MIDGKPEIDGLDTESRALAHDLVRDADWAERAGMRLWVHDGFSLTMYRVIFDDLSPTKTRWVTEAGVGHFIDNKGEPDIYPDLNDDGTVGVIEGMIWDCGLDVITVDVYNNGVRWGGGVAWVGKTLDCPGEPYATRGVVIAKLYLAVLNYKRESAEEI